MNTTLLSVDKDPMGTAIADYYKRHKAERLRVFSSQFDEDEIPVKELFRMEKQMPLLERTALQLATGKILDVGAGSGCHRTRNRGASQSDRTVLAAGIFRDTKAVTDPYVLRKLWCANSNRLFVRSV